MPERRLSNLRSDNYTKRSFSQKRNCPTLLRERERKATSISILNAFVKFNDKRLKLSSIRYLCNQIGSSSLWRRTQTHEVREREREREKRSFFAAVFNRKRSCHARRDYFHARRGLINVTSEASLGFSISISLTHPHSFVSSRRSTPGEIVIHACSSRFLSASVYETLGHPVAPPSCFFVFQFASFPIVGRTCGRIRSPLFVFLLLAFSAFFSFFFFFWFPFSLFISKKQGSRLSVKALLRCCTKFLEG